MNIVRKILFLIFFCAVVLSSSFAMGQFSFLEDPMIGKKSPDFTVDTFKSGKVNMTQFRNNQPAMIFFWATWCPHCRAQLKELNAKGNEIEKKGIKVILVDVGETAQEVKPYVERNKIMFDVFLDEDNAISDKYGIIGVPTFFFVNKDGMIVDAEHYFPENYEEILKK